MMEIGPFVVSRGAMVPYNVDFRTPQIANEAMDGAIVVTEKPYNKTRFIRAVIKVPFAEGLQISTFLSSGVRFKAIPFIIKDGFGQTWNVRFWDKRVREKHLAGGPVLLDLLFRVEVDQEL